MLNQLFQSLRNEKDRYLNARQGSEFEERIMQYLKMTLNLTRISKGDIDLLDWQLIKKHIGTKLASDFINVPNPNLKQTFVYQPYGSQQFPDLIVFTNKKVVPLEIKFSAKSQSKPIWNSNVPRANAFYVFGSYGSRDITFFCGDSIIAPRHRKFLYGFFNDIRALQDKIRVDMPALDITNRGFTPYIRAAFDQKKHKPEVATSFFVHQDRRKVENLAIKN